MSGNVWIHWACRLLLFLSLAPIACNLTAASKVSPPDSFKSPAENDLSGVWTGISISSCTFLRMTGPGRCGTKTYIKLTFIKETATMTGTYASVRSGTGNAFEQTGRIVEMPVKSAARLWLRVIMRDHSSCLFNSILPREEMEGSYLCFHNTTAAEQGRWAVQRSY